MKQDIENTTKLLIALIAVLYFAINESKAGDVTNTQANQTYQANQSNVGNKTETEYNQTYKDTGNYTGNTWANTTNTSTIQANVNASQQNQYTDSSETKISDSYNKTEVNDHSGSNNELKAYGGDGGDSSSKSYATSGSSSASTGAVTVNNNTGSAQSAPSQSNVNINSQQIRQHRIVPTMVMGASSSSYSPDNCNNSVSGQVGTGIFALGVSGSTKSSDCVRRRDATWWSDRGQHLIACNRMLVDSPENVQAMRDSGLTCAMIAEIKADEQRSEPTQTAIDTDNKLNSLPDPNKKIDSLFSNRVMK